ncbi:peptidoglycan-recognition protein LB-like [Leguminivora glycinivorella]|uniref:peptidoglycan-recognition protein LB-like n=1 Tax=Leguminivora glycinivorella TaxID=1035111 RepID=UPI00200EFF4A|nr:peptidoglycan-recognition protein LB-like [Leguminivora glycinivorella]XP_047999055.1 peptidoglycan-recognition protein LB-like [Leguminivora glycinivorella]
MAISGASYCLLLTVFCYVNAHPLTDDEPYPYYTREDWLATPATDVEPLSTPVPYVVIHHTYIPGACNTTEQCSASMRGMQEYHKSLGWGDIGYNFAVGSDGGAYEGRGWDTMGIHAGRANSHSLGIVLIGDWRVNLPPPTQLATTKALIAKGLKDGVISPQYRLIGHSQVMSTECPGGALLAHIATWDHYWPGHVEFKPATTNSTSNL